MAEKTIYIRIFQPFAQYRNPFTFYYGQTYPLPPKSTILGMLQNAIEDWYGNLWNNKWQNLKVSVHGGFESTFWNYQSLIKGELIIDENGRWMNKHDRNPGGNIWLPLYGEGLKSIRVPVHQQELFNGHLYIFIRGEEGLINNIKESLEKPRKILSLGRSEDIIFIRNVHYVEPEHVYEGNNKISSDLRLSYPTYIRREIISSSGYKKLFPIKNIKYPVYYIPINVKFTNDNSFNSVKHKSEINKNTLRVVEFVPVIHTWTDYSIILKEPLEKVEIFDVDNKKFMIIEDYGWL